MVVSQTAHPNIFFSRVLFLILSIAIGFNFQLGGSSTPLYVCHMIWITYMFGLLLSTLCHFTELRLYQHEIIFYLTIASIILISGLLRSFNPTILFLTESAKYLFSLATSIFLLIGLRNQRVRLNYIAYGIVVGIFISISTVVQTNPFNLTAIDLTSRLNVEYLGGFNTYAFMVANSILCSLYLISDSKNNLFKNILLIFLIVYFFTVLLATLSRNGMFSLFFGILVYLYYFIGRTKTLFIFGIFLALLIPILIYLLNTDYGLIAQRYIFDEDFFKGSGRFDVWTSLIKQMMDYPLSFIFGFGVGEINTTIPGSWHEILSAHNHFLQFMFEFGFIFLLGVWYFLFKIFTGIKRLKNRKNRAFLLAILSQIIFNMFLDSTFQSSQAAWLFSFWLTFIYFQSRDVIKFNTIN